MSTVKPPRSPKQPDVLQPFQNLLSQKFDQPAPNLVWVLNWISFTRFTLFQRKAIPMTMPLWDVFPNTWKKEKLDRRHFQSLDQLEQSLLSYIGGFYNPSRPHSHNHGLSPIQAENIFFHFFSCPTSWIWSSFRGNLRVSHEFLWGYFFAPTSLTRGVVGGDVYVCTEESAFWLFS